jgi:hypothetical protein
MLGRPEILTNVRFAELTRKLDKQVEQEWARTTILELLEVADGLLQRCESSAPNDNTDLMQRARKLLR